MTEARSIGDMLEKAHSFGEQIERHRDAMNKAWTDYCHHKHQLELTERKRNDEIDAAMNWKRHD